MIVKVSGLKSAEDVNLVLEAGVDLLGFVVGANLRRDESISVDKAEELISALPQRAQSVLDTELSDPGEVMSLAVRLKCDTIQLGGEMTTGELRELNHIKGTRRLMRSVLLAGSESFELAARQAPHCQSLVLEKIPGEDEGWDLASLIAGGLRISGRSVFLGGEISLANLPEALRRVQPAGVDVSRSIENTNGQKDADLLKELVYTARLEG